MRTAGDPGAPRNTISGSVSIRAYVWLQITDTWGETGLNKLGVSCFSHNKVQRKVDGLVSHNVIWFHFQDGAHAPRHCLQVWGKKRGGLRPEAKGPSQQVCSFLKSSPGSLICEFHSLARNVSHEHPLTAREAGTCTVFI